MVILTDIFNNVVISRHRSVYAAVRAKHKHMRAIKKRNGGNAYVWYKITCTKGEINDDDSGYIG